MKFQIIVLVREMLRPSSITTCYLSFLLILEPYTKKDIGEFIFSFKLLLCLSSLSYLPFQITCDI